MRAGRGLAPIGYWEPEVAQGDASTVCFGGILVSGPLAGDPFSGRFICDGAVSPAERHIGHSLFDLRGTGVVELTVDGWTMEASEATVFAGISNGRGTSFDFVTIRGEGDHDRDFEIFLGTAGTATLDPTQFPGRAQLIAMAGRTVTLFQGNAASVGELYFADDVFSDASPQ